MAASCAHLEATLPNLPFATGTMATVSDAYLYVVLAWLENDGVDINNYPAVLTFRRAMDNHPAVQAVRQKDML